MEIMETFVDETKGAIFGETGWYKPYTEKKGQLFRVMQKEYGRCVSSMYLDKADGSVEKIGWVFESKKQYEDTGRFGRKPEFYTRHVWVRLRQSEPEED